MAIRILLVDDHRLLREALRTVLEQEGDFTVVGEAGDGLSALPLIRERAPDVVLMDIGMSELNGIEATARIVARYPKLKVVALSAYADKRFVLEMFHAGAVGYVIKAAAGSELVRAIRAVVDGHSYICPEVTAAMVEIARDPADSSRIVISGELSRREREVLQQVAEGKRTTEIAARLHITESTVEAHRRNIMRKLELHTVADLTRYAIREGLVTP